MWTKVGPTAWSTARFAAACSRRSIRIRASSTRAVRARCASGRKPLLRARHHHPVGERRHHRHQRVPKALPHTRSVSAVATCPAASTAGRQRAGPPAGNELRGKQGHGRQRRRASPWLRAADSAEGDARQSPFPPMPAHFMVDATTGYIKHSGGVGNTDREDAAGAERSQVEGHEASALRHSQQPGGPLDRGDQVSTSFLPKGKMIVYTRGHPLQFRSGLSRHRTGTFLDIPMVVLANRNNAQCVGDLHGRTAGSRSCVRGWRNHIRQNARAVGLSISNGAGLALTTAHYFTPSDRLIQRPWDETFDSI